MNETISAPGSAGMKRGNVIPTTLAHEFYAVYAIWVREVKVFSREKSRVISALATPLIWIAIVGTGFASTIPPSATGGIDYRRYLFPGVIAQAILFGTVFYGMYIIWDRKLDVLKEILVSPISRTSIFFGKVVGGSTESMIQGVILLTIGIAIFGVSLPGALVALLFVALLAVTFVSIGLFIGTFFESFEGFQVVISFLLFPLFFLSGALFPVTNLPTWLAVLVRLNPVTYAVDGLRGVTVGVHAFGYAVDFGVLLGFCVVIVGAGTWAFGRMK
ncbi:MAG: ABC transporter permease [Thermoplasmatota archaeon]